jgi:Amt family ammonium transporter
MAVTQFTLILLACLSLLVRVGLAWYGTGLSRSKNAAGVIFRNAMDLSVAALAFWAVGAALLEYGGRSVVGIVPGLLFDAKSGATGFTFFRLVLVLIASGSLAGAIAERSKLFPPLALSALLAAVIVPIAGNWAWNDQAWLRRLGYIDFGGASVLHLTGGLVAAAAAVAVGPRSGKYNRDGSSNFIPGHNLPLASVGVLVILAGFLPYVYGAALLHGGYGPRTGFNVLLCAAAACVVGCLISNVRYGKPDVLLTYAAMLGGLVAITASAGACSTVAAVSIGAVAGLLIPTATVLIDLRWRIDDPTASISIHAVGGAWGTLAAGLFTYAPSLREKIQLIGVQALGIIAIALLALLLSIPLLLLLGRTLGLRLSEDAEFDGSDLAEHDLNAYPDFQQTMIKSYHMREA